MRRAAALATPPNGAAARALAPWIEHALLWLPAVAVFVAIGRYGVDVLWWDDWDSIGRFLLDVRANGLSWPALWVQDNEHRILLGRIFFLADAALGLSPQRLMIASQCVLSAAFALLVPMLRRSVVRWSVAQRSAFLFLSSALFFSFTQYENFFWSVQIGWSLMLFGFLLAMTGVQRERALRTVAGVAISFASTAHWAAAIPVVVAGYGLWAWRRRGTAMFRTAVLRLATMALACAALVVAYTQGWQFPPYHPSPALVVLHPLRLVGFATAELGAPFVWLLARPLLSTATLGGLLFLGAAAKALGDGKLDPHDPEPYLLGGALSLDALLTFGRSSFGLQQAIQSRYAICTIFGWTAVAALAARSYGASAHARRAILLVLALAGISSGFALRSYLTVDLPERRAAHVCLMRFLDGALPTADESCLKPLYPEPTQTKRVARRLVRRGLMPGSAPGSSITPATP